MAKESSTGILARTLTQKKHKDIHGINGLQIFYWRDARKRGFQQGMRLR